MLISTAKIDFEFVESYLENGESDEIINLLFDYFKKSVPERLHKCLVAIEADDVKEVRFQIHAIKNSFLNIGAQYLSEKFKFLEEHFTKIDKITLLQSVRALTSDYDFVLRSYREHFGDSLSEKNEDVVTH